MKLIDRLLMEARRVRNGWGADVCIVLYDEDSKDWVAQASAHNKESHEDLTSREHFKTMEEATQYCSEFMEKYESSEDSVIIINDILPGGEVYGNQAKD